MEKIRSQLQRNHRDIALASARETLNWRNHRVELVLGILVCILATFSVILMVDAVEPAIKPADIWGARASTFIPVCLRWIAMFFVVSPLYLGLYRMALVLSIGYEIDFADLFYFYGTFRLFIRGLRIVFRVFWNGLPMVCGLLLLRLFPSPAVLLSPLFLFFGWCFTARIFPFAVTALECEDMSLRQASRLSREAVVGSLRSVLAFRIRLLWRVLLSLLSIGVLTLLHTLPLTLLAYCEYSRTIMKESGL